MNWRNVVVVGLVVVLGAATGGWALEMSGRIDVQAAGMEFELTDLKACPGGAVNPASWLKDKQKTRCTMTMPVGKEWKQIWLEFVPAQSGKVEIYVMGGWVSDAEQRKLINVWADDVEVTGAAVKNGGFEETKGAKPAVWRWQGKDDRYSTDGSEAHTGMCCVKVAHDQYPIGQTIAVEAGKRCRVSVWFKSAAE